MTEKTKAAFAEDTSTYNIEELARAAEIQFKTTQDVAKAALKLDGKERYTLTEAKAIVNRFKKKEVK